MAKESGTQNTWYGITCWKVYAQGLASGWAGIMRYGAMYWTPLIVFFIMKGRSSAEGASSEELKHAGTPLNLIVMSAANPLIYEHGDAPRVQMLL